MSSAINGIYDERLRLDHVFLSLFLAVSLYLGRADTRTGNRYSPSGDSTSSCLPRLLFFVVCLCVNVYVCMCVYFTPLFSTGLKVLFPTSYLISLHKYCKIIPIEELTTQEEISFATGDVCSIRHDDFDRLGKEKQRQYATTRSSDQASLGMLNVISYALFCQTRASFPKRGPS